MEANDIRGSRVRRLGAAVAAVVLGLGIVACGNDNGDLELPPGPTEPTVPDTTPTQDPTGEPDQVPGQTVPGAPPGPAGDDVTPPGPGRGDPGEAPS